MSWKLIARKDFRDAIRERELHGYGALFALLGLGIGYVLGEVSKNAGPGVGREAALTLLAPAAMLFPFLGPLIALASSQANIVGKRVQGELKVLLGLPFSRRAMVLGTFLGRSALVLACLLAALVVSMAVALVRGAPLPVGPYVVLFAMLGVLSVGFVSVGVGVSAVTRSTTISSAAAFGAFMLFGFRVWDALPDGVLFLTNNFKMPNSRPAWAKGFTHLDPLTAYGNLLAATYKPVRPNLGLVGVRVRRPGGPHVYEEPWFAAVVLAAWILLPLVGGYLKFSRSDL